ncbi:MAG: DUF692 family multinuclear iron-containing protein [Hyphomicrobium sp.]
MLKFSPQQQTRALEFDPIPATAGIGLKPQHYAAIVEHRPAVGWFEIHPENYMGAGGAPHHYLTRIRSDYALSMHGVGLSIGAAGRIDCTHLLRLKELIGRYQPGLFSEHLAWSTHDGAFLNDLLPLPYTRETLDLVVDHIDEVQDVLDRRILIENPSTYLAYDIDVMSEVEFLAAISQRTGCGLLLDVNNVFVSAQNNQFDPKAYLAAFPLHRTEEIHLAGHAEMQDECGTPLLIDTHDRNVREEVWALYRSVISRCGRLPTLIEWDNDIPDLETLLGEATAANRVLLSEGL